MKKDRVTTSFQIDREHLDALNTIERGGGSKSDFLNLLIAENIHRLGDHTRADITSMVRDVADTVISKEVPAMMNKIRDQIYEDLNVKEDKKKVRK